MNRTVFTFFLWNGIEEFFCNFIAKNGNLFNIFIHAADPFRMERIRAGKAGEEEQWLSENSSDEELLELLRRKDKERWSYYDAHAQQRWGQAKNYDFTINSALLGIEESAEQIVGIIQAFERAGSKKAWIKEKWHSENNHPDKRPSVVMHSEKRHSEKRLS